MKSPSLLSCWWGFFWQFTLGRLKTGFAVRHYLPLLLLVGLVLAGRAAAQTFKSLHSFRASDGANPAGGLVLSGNTLYGTTESGGLGPGTVFALNTDGTGLSTLHQFAPFPLFIYTNFDGVNPKAGLVLSGNTLYGTTAFGGSSANGTVFAVKTDGTDFTVLHHFTITTYDGSSSTNGDGANPVSTLIISGNTLYGTALNGGTSGNGTLFAVGTDGTGFQILHNFTMSSTNSSCVYTNSDGAIPDFGFLSGNTLYGTATSGGSYGNGTIFSLHTDGSGFTTLHNFTNSDGAYPSSGLVLSSNTLYGTTVSGGSDGNGTIFSVHIDGAGFSMLHSFTAFLSQSIINNDGAGPQSLVISGNTLFGSAQIGGRSGHGTVFAVNIDGTDFTTLHDFAAPTNFPPEGYYPSSGLVLSKNVLYGTTLHGGGYSGNFDPDGNGTIFSISLPASPPRLTMIASGENLILSWLTNHAGFDYSDYILQCTTNLGSSVWTTNLPPPVVSNGRYTVTNPISGAHQFFRLGRFF
jgi:uncharacterized repeat protein (TIGR03803 family)